ncbi:MAG TPA: VOC family protein [Steroidobacteraceae bacterium]|nr:VOC family protein [Steroidobacteraceae bacterium]
MDHAFIGCSTGAPEGDALLRLGFAEGSANTHPGQGTANRRFFFDNFMLELLFVAEAAEVQNEATRRTRLWDRCRRANEVSPFGIIFRSSVTPPASPPFPTWSYAPRYLPPGLAIQIAEGTTLAEPELFYLPFLRRRATGTTEPVNHAPPIRRIRGLSVGLRSREQLSKASRSAEKHGLVKYFASPQPLLEILYEGESGSQVDLRPDLPLMFRGTSS